MAASEPDVGLLTSSAQIFATNHSLPQIRAIHKALNVQVDDKAARLRTQVGGSYRELLGTADAIVQMRGDMDSVRATLASMGGRCGRAVVGAKVAALAAFVDEHGGGRRVAGGSGGRGLGRDTLSIAARARLLEACARTAARLLSRSSVSADHKAPSAKPRRQQQQKGSVDVQHQTWGERLVLAAKVLVLSRLLITSLGDTPETHDDKTTRSSSMAAAKMKVDTKRKEKNKLREVSAVKDPAVRASVEASKKTLGSLRRRLRGMVEALERTVQLRYYRAIVPAAGGANGGQQGDDVLGVELAGTRTGPAALAAAARRDDLLRALCAYSLATTSGARDVLWQLLHVRGQAMAQVLELNAEEEDEEDDEDDEGGDEQQQQQQQEEEVVVDRTDKVLDGLALYTKTLLDVQSLLPHRLPEALSGLKRRALLDDEGLRQMEGLALDVHGRWCGDDVKFFKPYIRHDDLDGAQARDMLAKWAERGAEALLAGLQRALEGSGQEAAAEKEDGRGEKKWQQRQRRQQRQLDLHAIVDMRRRVLQLWIRDSSRVRGIDPAELLGRMRAVFNQHMLQVLEAKVDKLHLVGSEVAATVASWRDGVTDRHLSLWPDSKTREEEEEEGEGRDYGDGVNGDDGGYSHGGSYSGHGLDTDLSMGAVPFVRDVVARLHGRSDAVARAVASFATWRHVVDDAEAVVAQLRRQRWEEMEGKDGDGDGDGDGDEFGDGLVEDEDTIAQRQQQLSRDDPAMLQERLGSALAAAFADLDGQVAAAWTTAKAATAAAAGKNRSGAVAMYLVRVLREIRSRQPGGGGGGGSAAFSNLGIAIIPELHATIVRSVAAPALEQFVTVALARRTVAGRSLWELEGGHGGHNSQDGLVLPASPSPGVFKFLRDLSTAMSRAGMDLWSPTAVAALKRHLAAQLAERWVAAAEEVPDVAEEEDKQERDKQSSKGSSEAGEGTTENPGAAALLADQRRDLLLQWLLDAAWLRCCFGSAVQQQPWTRLEEVLAGRSGLGSAANADGAAAARKRIAKAARDYWKKTSLLFGLLV